MPMQLMRYAVALLYPVMGASFFAGQLSQGALGVTLTLAALLAGGLIARLHLRQPNFLGRLGVLIGTGVGAGAGFAAWAVAMLTLTVLAGSGEPSPVLAGLRLLVTLALMLVPVLGAAICGTLGADRG